MKLRLFALLLFLSLPFFLISQGLEGAASKKPEACVKEGKKQLQESPEDSELWSIVGACYLSWAIDSEKEELYDSAVSYLTQALILNNEDALAFSNRASAYFYAAGLNEENLEKALVDYNKALALNPRLGLAILNRSILLKEMEDYEGALEGLDYLISQQPFNPVFYLHRARIYKEATAFRTAINDYLKAIDLDSTVIPAYLEAGECYANLGFYPEAKDLMLKSIQKDKNSSSRAYFNLACYEMAEGNSAQSEKYFKKSLKGSYPSSLTCEDLNSNIFLQNRLVEDDWGKGFENLKLNCN